MSESYKTNKPYPRTVTPPPFTNIKIMQMDGWAKNGYYDSEKNKWYISDNGTQIEINRGEIYNWWLTEWA